MIRRGRIGLRHVGEADLPVLIASAADPQARGEWLPSRMRSPADLRKQFADDGFSSADHEMLLICDAQEAVIGSLVHFRAKRYTSAREIGWGIFDPALRGQGLASEAATLLVDYLFENWEIQRLECTVSVNNKASRRVAEKLGFVHEGCARSLLFIHGAWIDADTFGLLRADWQARRQA